MPWQGDLVHRFAVADRLLLHWQHVGALGSPERWAPLEFGPEGTRELQRRVALAAQHGTYSGTEQMGDLRALAEDLRCVHFPEADPGPAEGEDASLPPVLTSPAADLSAHEAEFQKALAGSGAEPGRVGPGEDEPPPEE